MDSTLNGHDPFASNVPMWIRRAWGLRTPPNVANADLALAAKLVAFRDYFERTRISGQFSPDMRTHFDNSGLRTTNLAEGWHNSLNYTGWE